ncbi:MAG: PHP domain-containing protein [Candidatus Omnitrophota bacterium]|jgi:predicted metal-dependent phosphoesterase TrpH|nr:MAG: PHP domain-containing protein [Candidatus Omnitrophota bacterium]
MNPKRIDLHTHTHCSDGTLSPTELIRKAAEAGLAAVAITDHDTTAGIAEAMQAGRKFGVEVIPGVEISAIYPRGTLHILGYYFDMADSDLQLKLREYINARNRRNPLILNLLKKYGYSLEMEEVVSLAGGDVINRPHIAQAMLNRGYVQSNQEAFDRFLGSGALAYVPKEVYTPQESVDIIHEAGGLAVLAHPDQLQSGGLEKTLCEIRTLSEIGIDGIEAFHGKCLTEHAQAFANCAEELGLFLTGGSDYHGDLKHDVELGQVRSLPYIPYEFVERMKTSLADAAHSCC